MSQPIWTIVLAAGAGRRLASFTDGVPKQFWHYDGRRSLLEATLERVAPLAPPDRTVIVIDKSHRRYLRSATSRYGRVLFQPADRGTAVGVLLGLTEVLDSAPEAVVLLTPSDHGVAHPSRFRTGIHEAVAHVQSGKSEVVLFGVHPTTAEGEYGWISPDHVSHERFQHVAKFVEKPSADHAVRLFRSGAVWNSMVLVASAAALFDLYWIHLPSLASLFARALHLSAHARETFLAEAYRALPPADFSHQLIAPAQGLSLLTWPVTMGWSDLGTPTRLERWMETEALACPEPARSHVHAVESPKRPLSHHVA